MNYKHDPTRIGWVRHVLGATVTVALDPEMAGVAPIYRGKLQPVGQIGSLVRIPQGLVELIGTVTLLGIAELTKPLAPVEVLQTDERWLQVQLLGEINRATGQFKRGVANYPALDDSVHFITPQELAAVYPDRSETHLRIGRLAAAEDVPVCLDAAKLVVRHSAVVGSTGAGKTSAVASLLQAFVRGGWQAANIIVVDPHGEYSAALRDCSVVRSVLGDPATRLRIPYWALPAAEILRIFTGTGSSGATVSRRFAELVTESRRAFASSATWLNIEPTAVTPDTPIPFDLRHVWHTLDYENQETRTSKSDPTTARVLDPGDAATLRPAQFEPYGQAGQAPHQAPNYAAFATTPHLLRLGMLDRRLGFLQEPLGEAEGEDPLLGVIGEWLGGKSPLSVLDFSGVPAEAAEVAVGVVLNLLFELAVRTAPQGTGIGRPNPVLIVLEEAHRYLGEEAAALTRDSANRIAREGRKYGVGLMLVTQRPTELPRTALAQCGTLIALRLSNSEDQGAIRAALPDTVAGLAAVLPSLRTGEAIVSGEALVLPSRVLVDRPEPLPEAEDPSLRAWRGDEKLIDPGPALVNWRGAYQDGKAGLDAR